MNHRPLDRQALESAAECLKILAHPSRLQIVELLLAEDAMTVNSIAERCELPQPTTSEHLRLMQRCGFLDSQRQGRSVSYGIAEPHLAEILACIRKRFGNGD